MAVSSGDSSNGSCSKFQDGWIITVWISLPKRMTHLCRIKSPSYGGPGSHREQVDARAMDGACAARDFDLHQLHRSRSAFGGRALPRRRVAPYEDPARRLILHVFLDLCRVSTCCRMAGGPV